MLHREIVILNQASPPVSHPFAPSRSRPPWQFNLATGAETFPRKSSCAILPGDPSVTKRTRPKILDPPRARVELRSCAPVACSLDGFASEQGVTTCLARENETVSPGRLVVLVLVLVLVVVVVVVVETLCPKRFVYRHKGVNHRQAAIENVKGRKRERERESKFSVHPREERARCHRLPRGK